MYADVNAFHILCMENENTANQTFNLGTGKMTNLMELKNMIGDIMEVGEVDLLIIMIQLQVKH